MSKLRFGAGIWHFATYVDRYATDGYGAPRSVIEAIDIAGKVRDLSVVDINYPFFGGEFSNDQVKAALARNKLSVIGITDPAAVAALAATVPGSRTPCP